MIELGSNRLLICVTIIFFILVMSWVMLRKRKHRAHLYREPTVNAANFSTEEKSIEKNVINEHRSLHVVNEDANEIYNKAENSNAKGIVIRPVVLNIHALPGNLFGGYDLLQTLLNAGFRFGKMAIFHYYESDTQDKILFSLASGVKPGTFDLEKMAAFSTPMLSLFFNTFETDYPQNTFGLMLGSAEQLAEELGGTLLDERREVLTENRIIAIQSVLK